MNDPFLARAKAHWTDERLAKVTAGKQLLLLPTEAPLLLRTLGLLAGDGSMAADHVRKFLQVNHALALLAPHLDELAGRHREVRVVDACCGTSYLALVVAWYLHERRQARCRIVGLDRDPKVIAASRRRAEQMGWVGFVRFVARELDGAAWGEAYRTLFADGEAEAPRPHFVLALHACDTATDHALALGVRERADLIAVAPCCQAELARKWAALPPSAGPFSPLFHTPNLRRDAAAVITDTLRLLLVRGAGYAVTATEFIPAAHTPKNRLLVAERRGNYLRAAREQHDAMKAALGGQGILLETLLAGGAPEGDPLLISTDPE